LLALCAVLVWASAMALTWVHGAGDAPLLIGLGALAIGIHVRASSLAAHARQIERDERLASERLGTFQRTHYLGRVADAMLIAERFELELP
jgi:hypothetical protein